MLLRGVLALAATIAVTAGTVSAVGLGSADAGGRRYQIGASTAIARGASGSAARHVRAVAPIHKQFCVYSAHTIGELHDFEKLVGAPVDCALMFNSTKRTWNEWSDPWFTNNSRNPNYAWPAWVKAKPGRRLIVTTSLIPTSGLPRDWMHRGAQGQYAGYATRLAQSLVKAGLGNSVIRLSHEANGKWNHDSVPNDRTGQQNWRAFWARTVTAMRAVSGANFLFDWAVNYQVRHNITLNDFYPGDRYVDIVGLDAYDENTKSMSNRFRFQQTRSGGINDVVAFAKAHGKQLSFPEWGILPVHCAMQGGGDQPDYVNGIANTIAANNFAYSSYWYAHSDTMSLLKNSKGSLAAMRNHFGAKGTVRSARA